MIKLLVSLALASSLEAQGFVSYPQDNLGYTWTHVVPFGTEVSNPNYQEGRWQQLIPSTHLPTVPSVISALGVASKRLVPSGGDGMVTYGRLEIRLSHTTATTLNEDFASNLSSSFLVFDGPGYVHDWGVTPGGEWSKFSFLQPFAYDGSSNLVIEIKKEVPSGPNRIGSFMLRETLHPNLPLPKYSFGPVGSGAADSKVGIDSDPLQLRFFVDSPTIYLTSNFRPQVTSEYQVGTTILVNVQAEGGSYGILRFGSEFESPSSLLGIGGVGLFKKARRIPVQIDNAGLATIQLQIPKNPMLVGTHVVWQGVLQEPSGGATFTNGADMFVQS